jgi:hypothetical protein
MIYNESVIGEHPARDGYRLDFFVEGFESPDFQSGSGSFTTFFPKFEVTGLNFEGKEQAQLPTGEGLLFSEDFNILEQKINLACFFSGDLNGQVGLATNNIKEIAIFTGESPTFNADTINNTNLIAKTRAQVDISGNFVVSVLSEDIGDRIEENISYKVVPLDFLSFGNTSQGVSGKMFSGFIDNPTINTTEYTISRSNIRDIEVSRAGTIDIFTGSNIIIEDGLILDFNGSFQVRTDIEDVTISATEGAILVSSSSSFGVLNNAITIPAGNNLSKFNVRSLLDVNDNREAFVFSTS